MHKLQNCHGPNGRASWASVEWKGNWAGENLPDEEIANPFFQHDSENYLEVDFTDEELGSDEFTLLLNSQIPS